MSKLEIYIAENCWSCEESQRIARQVRQEHAHVEVQLIDLDREEKPSYVFAVPTYVLDGRVIFLGNPSFEQLSEKLQATEYLAQPEGE